MLEEIEGAERKIFVGTFIWKGDEVGRYFVEALTKKTREGAEVCDLRRAGERGRAPFGQTFSGDPHALLPVALGTSQPREPAQRLQVPPLPDGRGRAGGFPGRLQHRLSVCDGLARHAGKGTGTGPRGPRGGERLRGPLERSSHPGSPQTGAHRGARLESGHRVPPQTRTCGSSRSGPCTWRL
jgi:hypothetical protein